MIATTKRLFHKADLQVTWNTDNLVLKLAVGYLLLPYFLFFWGWLRLPAAIIFILVIGFSYWQFTRQVNRDIPQTPVYKLNWVVLFIGLCVIGFWLLYSGVGHFADQLPDYKKHNLILSQLMNQDWPVIQKVTNKKGYILVYYFAYYLPEALVGKVFGMSTAQIFQFVYSFLGLLLVFYFVYTVVGKKQLLTVTFVFILFGGMDALGELLLSGTMPNLFHLSEKWATLFIYQGNTEFLYWVPQHALPGWLATLIFLYMVLNHVGKRYAIFVWSLTIFWSPWVFIGMLPLVAYLIFDSIKDVKMFFSLTNILPVFLIISTCVYFFSINEASVQFNYWVWEKSPDWLGKYIAFVLVEFLLLGLVLFIINANNKVIRELLALVTFTLLIIPLYHMGRLNDFCMRASIPAIVVLSIISIYSMAAIIRQNFTRISGLPHLLLRCILGLGFLFSMSMIASAIEQTKANHGGLFYEYSVPYQKHLLHAFEETFSESIMEQYVTRGIEYPKYHWLFKF